MDNSIGAKSITMVIADESGGCRGISLGLKSKQHGEYIIVPVPKGTYFELLTINYIALN